MATNYAKCERCRFEAEYAKFTTEDGYLCPNCGEEDDVFPLRMFKCILCGYTAEQGLFFTFTSLGGLECVELAAADPDPIEEGWGYDCSELSTEDCPSTEYEQIK